MRVFSGSTARDPPGGRLTDASDDHADSNDDAARQNQIEGKVLPVIFDLMSCASVSMRSHSVHVHRSTAQVGALIQMQTCMILITVTIITTIMRTHIILANSFSRLTTMPLTIIQHNQRTVIYE